MLKPVFTSFSERIWKVFPDLIQNRLAVESRDSVRKKIYGWSVDLDQPTAFSFDMIENWWCSLCAVHEGFAIWQGVEEEGLPVPLGIYAFNQQNGVLAWQNPDVKLLHFGPEVIIVAKPESPDRAYYLETQSGQFREEVLLRELPQDFLAEFNRSRFSGLHYPMHVSPGTDQYATMAEKIPQVADLVGPISSLVVRDFQILHKYVLQPDTEEITGMITVHQKGRMLISEISTGHYPNGFTVDPFFMMNNWLVWVEFPGRLGRVRLE